ncbi:MAG: hypothetical protein DRJ44_05745 [Thermoprotei archaeon]|nr:MAG: hypothetical protein DRJ44_05745 [Thermoprotei archaeon]
MMYKDRIFGKIVIKEPVIEELIESKPLQRLKKVMMCGFSVFLGQDHPFMIYNPWFNRFEHSVGVYLLLRKHGASLQEQVAGLLHDISHTAFSHIIDHVFGRETTHDYHEKFYKEILSSSEIPAILDKYGLDINAIADLEKFNLLEREIPDLCADRIDYFIRSMLDVLVSRKWALKVLDDIIVHDGKLVFKNMENARSFAYKYLEASRRLYCNAFQAALYHRIAAIVKRGLEKGVISKEDLFSDDYTLYRKLRRDEELKKLITSLNRMRVIEDNTDYTLYVKSKVRYVDPHVLSSEKLYRVSELDKGFKNDLKNFIEKGSRGFYVKIVYELKL